MRDRMFGMGFMRRSGGGGNGFSPLDLDPVLFLEASPTNTGTTEGNTIQTWSDLTANNNDAAQATEAKKPTLQLVNGVWVVRFDGSDDIMQTAAGVIASAQTSMTMVVVGKSAITNPDSDAFMGVSNGGYGGANDFALVRGLSSAWSATVIGDAGSNTASGSAVDTAYHTFVASWSDPNALNLYVDGVLDGTKANANVTNPWLPDQEVDIGGLDNGGSLIALLNGDEHAVLLYLSELSEADRQAVEAYFAPTVTSLNA